MRILLFLHIMFMFFGVTASYGVALFSAIARSSNEVARIRAVAGVSKRIAPLIPVLFITGLVFGLLTAITSSFDLLAPWLLIAYVLFAYAMITGGAVFARYGARVGQLAGPAPDGPPAGELKALLDDRRIQILEVIDVIVLIALIFDMVVKPFSQYVSVG